MRRRRPVALVVSPLAAPDSEPDGHSLSLTEITLAVDGRYPGKVDISDLFDHPTIREIADIIRG